MHATARAVSGSSVYVSDFPGIHDIDLLRRLVLPDGRVLRALLPGRPTRDSLFCDVLRDNHSLLKVCPVNSSSSSLLQIHRDQSMVKHLTTASWKPKASADTKTLSNGFADLGTVMQLDCC